MKTVKAGSSDYRKLLKSFNRSAARSKGVLVSRFGTGKADYIIRESRHEYETLIPHIPYIGDKNPFLIFLHTTSRYLAFFRILRSMDFTFEDIRQILCQMNEAEFKAIPYPVRRIIGHLWFSPWFMKRLRKRALESQQRRYPDDYVLTFIEGDGRTFDYGIDYTECGGCKFLKQQNAMELAPIMCMFDKAGSDLLGWGLIKDHDDCKW